MEARKRTILRSILKRRMTMKIWIAAVFTILVLFTSSFADMPPFGGHHRPSRPAVEKDDKVHLVISASDDVKEATLQIPRSQLQQLAAGTSGEPDPAAPSSGAGLSL